MRVLQVLDQATNTRSVRIFALLIALLFIGLPLPAQDSSGNAGEQIMSLVKAFIVELSLGDYDKMSDLVKPDDLALLIPKTDEAKEMMNLKNLPLLAPVREDLRAKVIKAASFSDPQIAVDGMSAIVTMKMVPDAAQDYVTTKTIYEVYLKEAYRAKKAGAEPPSLDVIKSTMHGTFMQIDIGLKVRLLLSQTPPPLVIEKTALGWRINLQKFLSKKA